MPATINVLRQSKIIEIRLAIRGPEKLAKEKKVQIVREYFGSVFSVIVFTRGPRSIDRDNPIIANNIIFIKANSINENNILAIPHNIIPQVIIHFGFTTSPIMPFISWPVA